MLAAVVENAMARRLLLLCKTHATLSMSAARLSFTVVIPSNRPFGGLEQRCKFAVSTQHARSTLLLTRSDLQRSGWHDPA